MKREYTIPTIKCVAIKMRHNILNYSVNDMEKGTSTDVESSGSLLDDDPEEGN